MDTEISFCIPVHNRLDDLKRSMPYFIAEKDESPPLEICILDYNSTDGLAEYLEDKPVTYAKYTGRNYYHMAHARNLSVLMAHGKYISIMSADIHPLGKFASTVRKIIDVWEPDWLYSTFHPAVLVMKKDEFISAGGYDEDYEYYGKEDKDLHNRLLRRGLFQFNFPNNLFEVEYTEMEEKLKNYRGNPSRWRMHITTKKIFERNEKSGILVANQGKEWGSWT